MDLMSLAGCLLGFVIMGVLTYMGWNILISSVAGAAAVVILAGLDPVTSYTELYLGGMGSFLTQYFGIMFFCALLFIMFVSIILRIGGNA